MNSKGLAMSNEMAGKAAGVGGGIPVLRRRGRGRARGFTLIEIMVVVSIIVILAAIGIAVGLQVRIAAQEKSTKATLATLDGAMSMYLQKTGSPEPDPGVNGTGWVQFLAAYPETASIIASLPGGTGNPRQVLDGYGNPIRYIRADPVNKVPGRFFSMGRDGKTGVVTSGSGANAVTVDYRTDDLVSAGVQ